MADRDSIRTEVRSQTDHDTDTQVTDAQLNSWIGQEYLKRRRMLAAAIPELYTKVSGEVVVPAGATGFSLISGGSGHLALTSFFKLLKVERKIATDRWIGLRQASMGTTVPQPAPATYRVWYLEYASEDVATNFTLNIPFEFERVIVEAVAARVRRRKLRESRRELEAAEKEWEEALDALMDQYGAAPYVIPDGRPLYMTTLGYRLRGLGTGAPFAQVDLCPGVY